MAKRKKGAKRLCRVPGCKAAQKGKSAMPPLPVHHLPALQPLSEYAREVGRHPGYLRVVPLWDPPGGACRSKMLQRAGMIFGLTLLLI